MTARSSKNSLSAAQCSLIIGLIAFFLTVPWLGVKYFYTRGEPREALVAQSMLRSGDWLVGSGYGAIVPSKPPMLHWSMAAAAEFFGVLDEFAARFPAALAFTLFLAFWAHFVAKRKGAELALLSSVILISCGEWFRSGVSARVDTLLTCFICPVLLIVFNWEQQKFKGLPIVAVLLLACGILTKGPVALVLVSAIFFCYLVLRGHGLKVAVTKTCVITLPASLLGSLWYLAAYYSRGDEFFARFFYENIARFASMQEDEPHKKNLLYLPISLLIGSLPWIFPVVAALCFERARVSSLSFKRLAKLEPFALFSLISVVVLVVFYSVPSGKRSVYLLPAYPFMCYGIANLLLDLNKRAWEVFRRVSVTICVVLGAAFSLLVLVVLAPGVFEPILQLVPQDLLPFVQASLFQLQSRSLISALCFSLVFFTLYAALCCSAAKSRFTFLMRLGSYFLAICLALNAAIFPAFSNSLSARQFSSRISALADRALHIYSFGYEFYGISFYLKRTIYRLEQPLQEGDLVLCYQRDFEQFSKGVSAELKVITLDQSSTPIDKPGEFVLVNQILKKG